MNRTIVIGSRGSELALWQANFVKNRLAGQFPDKNLEIKIIRTTGDRLQDLALSKIGDKGLFTRQIEAELLNKVIDLAVHSLKDLQTTQPDGLMIGAVCEREKPNDVLISRKYASIADLPAGATVATGSLRRRSQLLNLRPDVQIAEMRGNVPTRIDKFLSSDLDAMILAHAGLHRLELGSGISHQIPTATMLPAVGQGAVAVEIRMDDIELRDMVSVIDNVETRTCVAAERAFLRRLEGGCQVPIGALATMEGSTLKLEGLVGSLDGSVLFRETAIGGIDDSEKLGVELAERLIDRGAARLLDEARVDAATRAEAVL